MTIPSSESRVYAIERPDRQLWTYYFLSAFLTGPAVLFTLVYLYFRYHTMSYRFDAEGVSMRWGILFRREVNLTYARIQDIHLTSNIVERWLGLARIQVQTASGSSGAEMTIEGVLEYETLRDFLYSKMRGTKLAGAGRAAAAAHAEGAGDELALTLREVAAELRGLRQAFERERAEDGDG